MGDTRFRDGLALGRYANFYATSANIFTQADTTPDVTDGNLFFSNNTSNTTITNFDLLVRGPIPGGSAQGSVASQYEGKLIRVVFLDDSTRLVNASPLILASSDGLQGANNSIELIYHNSSWIEFGRSYNQNNVITVNSNQLSTNIAGTGAVVVTGRGSSVVVRGIAGASSASNLRRAIGGEQGTILHVVSYGASDLLVTVNSDAADTFISTSTTSATQFRLASSAIVSFVRIDDKWREIRPIWSNSTAGISQ